MNANAEITMIVTLSARESNGLLVCHTNCPLFSLCGQPLKIKDNCPIKVWLNSQSKPTHAHAFNDGVNPWPERISKLLYDNSMNNDDLASVLEVSSQAIYSWKTGKSVPRMKHQKNILSLMKKEIK